MRICACPHPSVSSNPRTPGKCNRCGDHISPDTLSNDQTVGEFMDRLEQAMFPYGVLVADGPPDWFTRFRTQIEEREHAGREKFGYAHVDRDNSREATEEAADLALYALYAILDQRRQGDEEEWSLALTAAKHAALAHQHALALAAHKSTSISPA